MGAAASVEGSNPSLTGRGDAGMSTPRTGPRASESASMQGGPSQTAPNLTAVAGSLVSEEASITYKTVARHGLTKRLSMNQRDRMTRRADSMEENTVVISRSGFSKSTVIISAGQIVTFQWGETNAAGFNVTQVVHDGDQFRPVIGGIHSGPLTKRGHFEHQFNMEGEFKFVSAGIRCTPLTVTVHSRREIFAKLTDNGFQPSIIRVETGESVKWSWTQCEVPHSMYKAEYCRQHCGLRRMETGKLLPTITGSFIFEFKHPGLYYFVATGDNIKNHLCVVHCHNTQREHCIEVKDREFEPNILVIEEGDRVWWKWDKLVCKKLHSVYQIQTPQRDRKVEEPFRPLRDGFRWSQPSKSGLMAQEFYEAGIFFYSDHNFQETAEYAGCIIVKPAVREHFISLSGEGFDPDLLEIQAGERVWWNWNTSDMDPIFNIMEVEKCLTPSAQLVDGEDCGGGCVFMDDESARITVRMGLEVFTPLHTGVYHFRISDSPNSISSSSIVVQPGPRNLTVHVTSSGFEPRVLTGVHPGDRVWWVWQGEPGAHNIVQVNHEGAIMEDGFCSGAQMDCPAAFTQVFDTVGVFYYISEGHSGTYGAVVVGSQPQVHEVLVETNGVVPDPLTVRRNDVVVWTFRGLRQHDLVRIESMGQILDAQHKSMVVQPRRCMNRAMADTGIHHFTSKSFLKTSAKSTTADESRVSSILAHDYEDSEVVRVSARGFFPPTLTLRRGQSVLWSWREAGSEEQHNIVHVNPPSSEAPLSVIQGDRAFTSGRPVPNNSFLYTFDAMGMFCVASIGCPGLSCSVLVLNEESAYPAPQPSLGTLENGGTVSRGHTVYLDCADSQARIFYTVDGSPPLLHRKGVKMYKPKEGIVLRKPGLFFVRAIAVTDNALTSAIFTSKRFWVLQNVDEAVSDDAYSIQTVEDLLQDEVAEAKEDSWQWWNCVPVVKSVSTAPGVIDVFWEPIPKACEELIKGYQIYLNGVSYGLPFDSGVNCLSLNGLAGGRVYDAWLHVEPVNPMFLPHKSNHLMLTVPKIVDSGGPLISIERTEEADMLAIVWMSISTREQPIQGYFLSLNGRRCGQMVVPEPDSSRCKVVIEGCALDRDYQIQVFAISALMEGQEFPSNEIFIHLPLETADIRVPDTPDALETPELYREFIVVNEGTSLHLAVEDDSHRKRLRSLIRRDTVIEGEDEDFPEPPSEPEPSERVERASEEEVVKESVVVGAEEQEDETTEKLLEETGDVEAEEEREEEEEKQEVPETVAETVVPDEIEEPVPPEETAEEEVEEEIDLPTPIPVAAEIHEPPVAEEDEIQQEEEKDEVSAPKETELQNTGDTEGMDKEEADMETPSAGHVVEVQSSVDLSVAVPIVVEESDRTSPAQDPQIVPVPLVAEEVEISSLPAPEVELITTESEDRFSSSLTVEWGFSKPIPHKYFLRMCVVNVIGNRFSDSLPVNSNISFEASHPELGMTNALQHCWNVLEGTRCVINGLSPGETYKVFVVADFVLLQSRNSTEVEAPEQPEQQISSSYLSYTTLGPPHAPSLWVDSSGMYEVTLGWSQDDLHSNDELIGFRLMVDSSPFGEMLSPITKFSTLNNLAVGATFVVSLVAVGRTGGQSTQSNEIYITCPQRPPAPKLRQEPAYNIGSVVIAWDYPSRRDRPPVEDITKYSVFVDGQWRDELPAHHTTRTYQYQVDGLLPGVIYDVGVKALAGQGFIRGDTAGEHVYCLVESEFSELLSVTCIAPPASPQLKIEAMNTDGLELSWDQAQSFGEANTTGYQLLRDGTPYGAVIPPDVTSLTVRDLTLGQRISLQLVALTNHPVAHKNGAEAGVEGLPERYRNCIAGPTLTVHYTGLVMAPSKVWCEAVTGHSAMIIWDKNDQPKPHHVRPDNYQVTWWPGERPDRDIHSESTTEDYLVIDNLNPDSLYTVHVEARKLQSYDQFNEENTSLASGSFILTGRSEPLSIRTAAPPEPASNLGVVATTCHSLLVAWDAPKERGVEVASLHVRCFPTDPSQTHQIHSLDLVPDATRAVITQLSEKTEYSVSVFAVTDEYFHTLSAADPMRHDRKLRWPANGGNKLQIGDESWIPSANILASTSGTQPASNVQVVNVGSDTAELRWKPPQVFGSNRLKGQVVRWCEVRRGMPAETAEHMSLDPKDRRVTLEGLLPGALYRISLETIVSVKSNICEDETGDEDEKKNRRTAHVPAQPILVRTRSPADPPSLLVTGITESSISLYWERPVLFTVLKSPHEDHRYIRRHLEGYRLLVNGRAHTRLKASAQSVTLTKCRPGKEYRVVLIALTLTDDAKKEMRRRNSKANSRVSSAQSHGSFREEDIDVNYDEAESAPLVIHLQSSDARGAVRSIHARYLEQEGVIQVDWTLDNAAAASVRQVDLRWRIDGEARVHQKSLDAKIRATKLSKIRDKAIYHITVEPVLLLETSSLPLSYTISVQTPGSPDPPQICTRSVSEREIMIEWAEPRLFGGVTVRGYQLYMNERSVGSMLHASHRKAIIPSRPNRHYKIALVALSSHSGFSDSVPSNSLLISTAGDGRPFVGPTAVSSVGETAVETADGGSPGLPVRVSAISDTTLTLDWMSYLTPSSLSHFKLQWSNAAQAAERWQRLDASEKSCELSNCLPGMTHFVRLTAYSDTDEVLDKSAQLRVQTSAPIDAPVLSARAANFSYVSVQWATPRTYGDAVISGYKLYVNGVVEAILAKDELVFSYTQGRWCHDYVFQVQALCAEAQFSSRPSEPLTITWPGCQPSLLSRRPSSTSNSIRVGWDEPYSTSGVTLKHFRLLCSDLETHEIVQTVGPLHPDTREAELFNLPRGTYSVYLEIHLHGTKSVVQSDSLTVQPTLTPDPPQISVVVIGLEERRQIERVTCELINRRDKLVRFITGLNRAPSRSFDENELLSKATEAYNEVEDMIEDCFASLSHYTGHLLVQLSWTDTQSSEDISVSGFKVLVDGKQYGTSLHSGIHTVRVKLGVDVPLHRITMVAMSERPLAISPESNAVELLTEPFRQMHFFCVHEAHKEGEKWPKKGCCLYQDSLTLERRQFSSKFNPGPSVRHIPPPAVFCYDLRTGEPTRLLPTGGPRKINLIFFWTRWCLASQTYLKYLVRFAKENTAFRFVAVAVERTKSAQDVRELNRVVQENNWHLDGKIQHFFTLETEKASGKKGKKSSEMEQQPRNAVEVLGVFGVPFFIIVHPEDYIAFRGRYCASEFSSFNTFLTTTLKSVTSKSFTDEPKDWMKGVDNMLDHAALRDRQAESVLRVHQASSYQINGTGLMTGPSKLQSQPLKSTIEERPPTAIKPGSRLFSRPSNRAPASRSGSSMNLGVNRISVNTRPFSARSDGSPKRAPSPMRRPTSANKSVHPH